MRPTAILIPAIAALALATTTHAQCDGTWLPWPTTGQSLLNSSAYALASWDPDGSGPLQEWLYVGGDFTQVGGVPGTQFIAAWDGQTWHPVGGPFDNRIDGLLVFENKLVAVGPFTVAGDQPARGVASWDGSAWTGLGIPNAQMMCLGIYKGRLIAGGFGSALDRAVIEWDGKEWHPLGNGITDQPNEGVAAIAEFNGDLYVGGRFFSVAGVAANNVARWDGSEWHPLESGVAGIAADVRALHAYNGFLYAGGAFRQVGASTSIKFLAKWNGQAWSAAATSVGNIVNSLCTYRGALVVGGYFLDINTIPFNRIASWNGTSWSAFGTGVSGSALPGVFAATTWNGELAVTGALLNFGAISGWSLGHWSATGIPTIAAHPQPLTINPSDTATFTTTPTYGYASLSTLPYQWHRNNQRLDDDNRITGATTPTLTIAPAQLSDAGDYTCAITNTCGTITTNPAALTINTPPPPCPGDANHDNTINGADLSVLLSNFGNTVPPGTAADFNNNGIINGADLSVLLSNFGASCP